MSSEWIIGALAFVTIALVLGIAVYHFGTFLKDPRNRGAAKNVLQGGESETTKAGSNVGEPDKPLGQRLDESQGLVKPRY